MGGASGEEAAREERRCSPGRGALPTRDARPPPDSSGLLLLPYRKTRFSPKLRMHDGVLKCVGAQSPFPDVQPKTVIVKGRCRSLLSQGGPISICMGVLDARLWECLAKLKTRVTIRLEGSCSHRI